MNLDDQENPLAFAEEPELNDDADEKVAIPDAKSVQIDGKASQKKTEESELLSKSEFDSVAFRMTNSLPALTLVREVLSSPTPLRQAILRAEDACQKITVRSRVLSLHRKKGMSLIYRLDVLDSGW